MAVLPTVQLDERLRAAIATTDITVKLQMIADTLSQSVAASSDMTNILNAATTEITRRKALTPERKKHDGT